MKFINKFTFPCLLLINSLLSCSSAPFPGHSDNHSAYNHNIIGRIVLPDNSLRIIVNRQDSLVEILKVTDEQCRQMKALETFKLDYRTNEDNYGYVDKINILEKEDSTKFANDLYVADGDEIDDFKRRDKFSYAIIQIKNDTGMRLVSTPKEEISRLLRLENYKFYYYRNWDGTFHFDHIETN